VRAETVGRGLATELALSDLSVEGVRAFLLDRYGSIPAGRLEEWLHDRTDGNPRFLTQYLDRLEDAGILRREGEAWTFDGSIEGEPGRWSRGGRLAEIETPRNLLELLRPRIAALDEDEFALLQTGAVQGRRFLSAVLVRLLDREENEIFARLHTIARRRRLIEAEGVEGWWSEKSAQYTFDPGLLQELLYDEGYRDPYERRRGHAAVAGALEVLIADEHPPPRHALLEIAAHYEQAGNPLQAAAKLIEVADSTFAERADRETGIHATRALALLRKVQPKQPTDDAGTTARRLVARAILLLLIGGEVSWTAYATSAEGERLIELAEEGERVATELGDEKLRVNALYAKAYVQTICGSLEEALALYQDALDAARVAGDPLAEFSILVTYGHQLDSVDLHQGLKLLEEAHELLVGDALTGQLDERQRASQMALIESRLGVAAFDLGRYGEALDLLTRSSVALREFRNHDERAWSQVFLAQVYTAVGLYESGEAAIRDALELFADDSRPLGVRGYLYSLLGRLYLEWEPPKLDAAREALLHARVEARESGHRTVMPFADIFWAALLFAEGTPEKLREADDVLAAVTSFGWERSEISARSLRARIALAEGRTGPALELSWQAVTPLEKRGDVVPTVRAEEIYFTHARALEAADQEQAEHYYAAAARVVREKLDSLHDAAQRDSYQRRVRVSREILAARENPHQGM
jgi:tetratricopeptide (TPR) repeat protein